MDYIRSHPGLDDDELSQRLGIHPRQAINQIANLLAAEGLIVRAKNPGGKLTNRPKRTATARIKRATLRAMVRRWISDKKLADRWALKHDGAHYTRRPSWEIAGSRRRYRCFTFYDDGRDIELRIFDTDGDGFGFSFHAYRSRPANFSLGLKGPGSQLAPVSHASVGDGGGVLHFPPRSQSHALSFDIPIGDDEATLDALLEAGLRLMRASDGRSPAEKAEMDAPRNRDILYALQQVRSRQSAFRSKLMRAYDFRCALSGCKVPEILTAAHIVPHAHCKGTPREEDVRNGILLRVDLHVLFDAGYFDLVARGGKVFVNILETVEGLGLKQGQALKLPANAEEHPCPVNLEERLATYRPRR